MTSGVTSSRYTDGMVRSKLRVYLTHRAFSEHRGPYTVREVAEGSGLSPSIIQGIFSDKFTRIDKATIDKICSYLGCQIEDWLVWEKGTERE